MITYYLTEIGDGVWQYFLFLLLLSWGEPMITSYLTKIRDGVWQYFLFLLLI